MISATDCKVGALVRVHPAEDVAWGTNAHGEMARFKRPMGVAYITDIYWDQLERGETSIAVHFLHGPKDIVRADRVTVMVKQEVVS